jgi:hypothetical protein
MGKVGRRNGEAEAEGERHRKRVRKTPSKGSCHCLSCLGLNKRQKAFSEASAEFHRRRREKKFKQGLK